MRVLIDEDIAVQLMEPLRHLLRRHTVDHIATISWKGKKDGYEVIITRDHNQLSDPAECDAIKKSIAALDEGPQADPAIQEIFSEPRRFEQR